jgi:hypothetical protein
MLYYFYTLDMFNNKHMTWRRRQALSTTQHGRHN